MKNFGQRAEDITGMTTIFLFITLLTIYVLSRVIGFNIDTEATEACISITGCISSLCIAKRSIRIMKEDENKD